MPVPDPLELLAALIRCPSVTPAEGGALSLIESALAPAGFTVYRPVFSQPGTDDVENLYARIGGAGPCFIFAGHSDVVPPGDLEAWTHDPFGAEIDGGLIYGRGATDMKGGLACMIVAALRFLQQHPDFAGSIGFLIAGDEEGVAVNGTARLLQWARERGERFDYCILGEPTCPDALGDMIKIGRRGSLTGALTVHGRQGHVGYPELAHNPIPDMMRLIEALLAPPLDAGSDHFGPSNLEVTSVDTGNTATNVIPARTKAVFNVRFNDRWDAGTLQAELRRRLELASAGAIAFTLEFAPSNSPAFLIRPDGFVAELQDIVQQQTGIRPRLSTSGGTSDARFIKDYCPVIEFGGVGRTMHQVDENMAVADLEPLTGIYCKALEAFFARPVIPPGPPARTPLRRR